jgi:hypothetical protein
MRGAINRNTPAASVTIGSNGLAASRCIQNLYQIRVLPFAVAGRGRKQCSGVHFWTDALGRGCLSVAVFSTCKLLFDRPAGCRAFSIERAGSGCDVGQLALN